MRLRLVRPLALAAVLLAAGCESPALRRAPKPPTKVTPAPVPSVTVKSTPSSGFYEPELKDPALDDLEERADKAAARDEEATATIKERQKAKKAQEEEDALDFVAQPPEGDVPTALVQLAPLFHFPPERQYRTGTCWAFSSTSFLESEIQRLSGRKVRLAPLYAVYFEYVEKARRFVAERGDSLVDEGSQFNAVLRVYRRYGALPLSAYPGTLEPDGRIDHDRMLKKLQAFLDGVKSAGLWDESFVLAGVRAILDETLGRPPERFSFEGKDYTPATFLTEVTRLNPDDYVQLMSTLRVPFFTAGEFRSPDNWWHDDTYVNVPLDVFYEVIRRAVPGGYTLAIGGDTSEPGKLYRQNIAFIPSFDIPVDRIDQVAREYRIANGVTTDDHGVHLVGMKALGGHDWFAVKDSAASAWHGPVKGYYFYRDDFVRLKMLSLMIHREAVLDLLARVKR